MEWVRVCIDLNERHDVVGISLELHAGSEVTSIIVHPVGPFDSPFEELERALTEAKERWGQQLNFAF